MAAGSDTTALGCLYGFNQSQLFDAGSWSNLNAIDTSLVAEIGSFAPADASVPEPASWRIMVVGAALLGWKRRTARF